MNLRAACVVITVVATAGTLVGLGILFFGTPEQAVQVPASGLLVAAVAAVAGAIYLGVKQPRNTSVQKSQSMLSTIGFAILVVTALFVIGLFFSF